ncbi:baseplate J/gp47 family protein [Fusobacterium hominis]|uniref:Baseplate J/gp47 family protein n=1 Tax=Fusobacterium hominis TaxID=2764326 RepID=A0A7G9GXJ2_9FUSO|nr:baseplate J/gp47 family protein [Fusobacterium hominis]QNM15524.1 baseplate J/gp47 family protein [Fusobacterium hominis]
MKNDIELINSDPKKIYEEGLKIYKELSGEDIPPASILSYELSTFAALLGNIKAEMNRVALENYLPYAHGVRLDLKGTMYGDRGKRLQANKSRTTMRCNISQPVNRDVYIAKGTRFINGEYIFKTEQIYKIAEGKTYIDVVAVCESAGETPKILKGELNQIVDRYDYFESCENITDVTGGSDEENDDMYRARLEEIPESFTSAGSDGAYKYWTKKASSLVTDVEIISPTPNNLEIYVVNKQEKLSTEEKNKIKAFLEQPNIKALNDKIIIKDPTIHEYTIDLRYTLYRDAVISKSTIEDILKKELKNFTEKFNLGRSLNIQDIIGICKSLKEVKKVEIVSPSEYQAGKTTICKCTKINLSYAGSDD